MKNMGRRIFISERKRPMRPCARRTSAWIWGTLAVLCAFSGFAAATDLNPFHYLPVKGDVPGWSPAGEPEIYKGEDLFRYMDGGAEVYNEYGFREVAVQEYENSAGKQVSLEIYEMSSAEAAFGMYAFKTTGTGKSLELGCAGEIEDYYLNFWKGRFLVTLAGYDDEAATRGGLIALGRAVDTKIKEACAKPSLAGILLQPGLRQKSVKYFRGVLGVRNVYALFPDSLLVMAEGLTGDYEDGSRVFIFKYADDGTSRRVFSEMQTEAGSKGSFEKGPRETGEFLRYADGNGESVLFRLSGALILAGMGTDVNLVKKRLEGIRP